MSRFADPAQRQRYIDYWSAKVGQSAATRAADLGYDLTKANIPTLATSVPQSAVVARQNSSEIRVPEPVQVVTRGVIAPDTPSQAVQASTAALTGPVLDTTDIPQGDVTMPLPAVVGTMIGGALASGVQHLIGGGGQAAAAAAIAPMQTGRDIEIVEYRDPVTGQAVYREKGRRRRRRRLLTASDKADIAFLRGNLGGGELGRAAISAVLSRRVG